MCCHGPASVPSHLSCQEPPATKAAEKNVGRGLAREAQGWRGFGEGERTLSASHHPGAEDGMACWPVAQSVFSTVASLRRPPLGGCDQDSVKERDRAGGEQHSRASRRAGSQVAGGTARSPVGDLPPSLHSDHTLKYQMGVSGGKTQETQWKPDHSSLVGANIPSSNQRPTEEGGWWKNSLASSPFNIIAESRVLHLLPASPSGILHSQWLLL